MDTAAKQINVAVTNTETYGQLQTAWNGSAASKVFTMNLVNGDGATVIHGNFDATTTLKTGNGVDGGGLIAADNTTSNIAGLINANQYAAPLVTATSVTNGAVTAMQDSATYNTGVTDGGLQFTGPEEAPNIQFVNPGPNNSTLSVDLSNAANTYTNATAVLQSTDTTNNAGGLQITALNGGSGYNGVNVKLVENSSLASPVAFYDPGSQTLEVEGASSTTPPAPRPCRTSPTPSTTTPR